MTPKPTLSLESLKNKALAAKALGEEWYSMSGLKILYLVEEDADFITTISPDVVLDLLERLTGMEEALKFLIGKEPQDGSGYACTFCDMGGSGYSTKGDGHHDDVRHVCPVLKAKEALEKWGTK